MSKPNPLALYQSVEYLKAEVERLTIALGKSGDAHENAIQEKHHYELEASVWGKRAQDAEEEVAALKKESLRAELALQDVIQERDELKALLKIAADALEAANENSRGFMQESGPDTFTMPIIDEALAKIRGAGGVK